MLAVSLYRLAFTDVPKGGKKDKRIESHDTLTLRCPFPTSYEWLFRRLGKYRRARSIEYDMFTAHHAFGIRIKFTACRVCFELLSGARMLPIARLVYVVGYSCKGVLSNVGCRSQSAGSFIRSALLMLATTLCGTRIGSHGETKLRRVDALSA